MPQCHQRAVLPRCHCRHDRPRRRGSVYLLTLGLGTVLAIVGMGVIAVNRVNARTVERARDWVEAQSLTNSAVEHAIARINADTNWRTDFNGLTIQGTLGRGNFAWKAVDEVNGSLTVDPTAGFTLTTTGSVGASAYCLRVHMNMTGTRLKYGISSIGTVSMQNINTLIDSYDSSLGAYGGSNVGSQAMIATNGTVANSISLSAGAIIDGWAQVGPGGDPNTAISVSGSTITGSQTVLSQALTLPPATAPTGLGASVGSLTYNSGTTVISSNLHVTDLTVQSGAKLQISGQVIILADGPVTFQDNQTLIEVLPGASLKLYVSGAFTTKAGATTIVDGPNMSRMQIINLGTNTVTLQDNNSTQGVIISPNGPVLLKTGAGFYGALVAKSVTMTSAAAFHQDLNITLGNDPVLTGGATRPQPDSWNRVVR